MSAFDEETHRVEAANPGDAERAVLAAAKREPFAVDKASVREQVVRTE